MGKKSSQGKRDNPGRPTLYDPDIHPMWAWMLAVEGKDAKQIADAFGVSKSTLYNWADEHDEFMDALKTGREPADAQVVKSLFKRATGYEYRERKVVSRGRDAEGNPIIFSAEETTKHIPPDTGAACMWLKNRLPDKWRDKPKDETEFAGMLAQVVAAIRDVK